MARTTPTRVCGTADAFRAHRQRAEECDRCERAQTARTRADQSRRLKAIHAAGGSAWGDVLHGWLGHPPCPKCRPKANAARNSRVRTRRSSLLTS